MKLYTKLKQISAVVFHDIKFTGNVYLMDIDFDDDKKYDTKEIILINETWLFLYDEYFEKTDDPRLRRELKNRKKNVKLLIRINILNAILKSLKGMRDNKECIPDTIILSALMSFKVSLKRISTMIVFDPLAKLETNIKYVESYTFALGTRYKLLFKADMNIKEGDLMMYYTLKSNIEDVLKKDNIPDHINMLQWIAYEKMVIQKLRHGRQHDKRGRGNKRVS